MVLVGSISVVLTPAEVQASYPCTEFGQSLCVGSCIYFDEPIYYFTQNCDDLCRPNYSMREIWVAGARCDGILCWTFYGCYQP